MPDSPFASVEGLAVVRDGAVLRLTLDNPGRRNALDDAAVEAMIRALEAAATDDELRAIAISGAGEHFCGGFDIVSRNASGGTKPRTGSVQRRIIASSGRLISLLLEVQLPVVCAVRGWAVGIGAQIAVACDLTVVAEDARFWWPFVRRGFTPDSATTWLLPRVIGPARAREVLLLSREISGTRAYELGLVARAVPAADLDATSAELLQEAADGPTVAMGLTKALLNATWDNDLDAQVVAEGYGMELSSRSPDFREGLAALVGKRPPAFGGR